MLIKKKWNDLKGMFESRMSGIRAMMYGGMKGRGLPTTQPTQKQQVEIENLKAEIQALELMVGEMIVARERFWIKSRLKTIAKNQLRSWKLRDSSRRLLEGRSLMRYISTLKENDAVIAQQMLHTHVFENRDS